MVARGKEMLFLRIGSTRSMEYHRGYIESSSPSKRALGDGGNISFRGREREDGRKQKGGEDGVVREGVSAFDDICCSKTSQGTYKE